MTDDLGLVSTRRESPAAGRSEPAELPQGGAPAERRLPTARECGLGTEEDATVGARCRDLTPELMIELI